MSASRYRRWGFAPLEPRARALVLVAVVAATLAAAGTGRAPAAPLRSCTPTHGTIVAVDFAHWGGPIVRGCGIGRRSGYALLHAAGFTTAGDAHDGPGVICRLGDAAFRHGTQYPTPGQEACVATPPTSRYWAYWVAPAGSNHWSYSPLGAMADVPKPGEVELWIFGATNVAGTHGTAVPSFRPAALRAHASRRAHPPATTTATTTTRSARARTRRTTATTTRTATPAPRTPTRTTTTRATTHSPVTATSTTTTHRAAAPPAHPRRARPHPRAPRAHRHHRRGTALATPPSTTTTTSTTRRRGARIVAARPTTRAKAPLGSATPLIIAGALVLLLCAGAGRAIWLRRGER